VTLPPALALALLPSLRGALTNEGASEEKLEVRFLPPFTGFSFRGEGLERGWRVTHDMGLVLGPESSVAPLFEAEVRGALRLEGVRTAARLLPATPPSLSFLLSSASVPYPTFCMVVGEEARLVPDEAVCAWAWAELVVRRDREGMEERDDSWPLSLSLSSSLSNPG
jgi:hypothetical protein